MSERTDEVVYLNNCQLVIQSLSFKGRGSYYLLWKKGKKATQSSKFQPTTDQPITPNETLTLSLKLYHLNGVPQPRHTHLILCSATGEELDRLRLMVHEWGPDFKEGAVELAGNTVRFRGKRRAIMKLEKFHRLRSELEESSDQEANRFLRRTSGRGGEGEKEQLLRLGKQLEDQGFLVERLKEERNSALLKVQRLEEELGGVEDRMRGDLAKLRDYSQLRMEMRESIYKEEIQQLVSSFNRNYDLNRGLLEGLIREKYDYEHEIEELKESNQEYITHQEANFERIIAEMENHKKLVDEELQDSNEKLKEREAAITELNDHLDAATADAQKLREENAHLIAEREREYMDLTGQLSSCNAKLAEYEQVIDTQKLTIKTLTDDLTQRDTELVELHRLLEESVNERNQLGKLNLAMNEEKEQLLTDLTFANGEISKLRQDLTEQTDQISKMREAYEESSSNMVKDLETRELNYAKEIDEFRVAHMQLQARNDQLFTELEHAKAELEMGGEQRRELEAELEMIRRELQSQKLMYDHLMKENSAALEHFKQVQDELNEKLTHYIARSTEIEIENNALKLELREVTTRTGEEMERMREEYQRMMESNRKLYDDELELLRAQREEETTHFDQVRSEYEQEIQQLMDHQKADLEEIEAINKEELEAKTQECLQLMHRNSTQAEEIEELKMQLELAKKQNTPPARKGRMPKRWNQQAIEEEDEEDEPIETVEVQSEEEEDEEPLVVRKKLKRPPKKQEEEEEQEEFKLGEDEEEQHEGDSIIGLYKQKHTHKSKLKKGNKVSLKTLTQEAQQEEQEEQQQVSNPPKGRLKSIPRMAILEEQEHSDQAKKSDVEEVQVFSEHENQAQAQPEQKPQQKPKLQKRLSKKHPVASVSQEEVAELRAEKEALSQRVDQLQSEVSAARKNEKKMKEQKEKDQKRLQAKIRELQDEVEQLKKELQELNASIGEKDTKLMQALKKQSEVRNKQADTKDAIRAQPSRQREAERQADVEASPRSINTSPRKAEHSSKEKEESEAKRRQSPKKQQQNIQQYLQKIEDLQRSIDEKQRKIDRLDQQNRDLSRQVQKHLSQNQYLQQMQQMHQSKSIQTERKQVQLQPQLQPQPQQPLSYLPSYPLDQTMKASIANLEERVSNEREKYQQTKLKLESKSRECEALEGELRRAKQRSEELEERIKKQTLPRSMQEMQSEIDDANRKILELSRTLNQARLEKDSFEDETRLLKKKLAEVVKTGQEWQARAGESEREAEELRRKEQRWKREGEEWREEEKRLKQAHRRTIDDLGEVRKAHSEFMLQRKKVLEDIVRLEGVITQKETEAVKLNKELQKLRGKFNEETEGRTGKERELRSEFQRLELERSKAERRTRQLQETTRILKEKLEAAEKQAKKNLQQRKQTYGEKLRRYIEEITAVKQVVQHYQQENAHLTLQNSEFFEQNEILKVSYEKLQIKLEELTSHASSLEAEVEALQHKVAEGEEALKAKVAEQQKTAGVVAALRRELDGERVASRKKTERLQSYEEINERYLYQLKELKLRLSQYENSAEDAVKLTEEFHASQRTIDSLQEELHKITQEYQEHSSRYVYTRQEVDAALQDLRQHDDNVKEEEIARVVAELDQAHAASRKAMEAELLALYAENEKLRVALQKTTEDAVQLQRELGELETLREKVRGSEKERSILERRGAELSEELKAAREEGRRLEVRFNESVRSQEGKTTENVLLQQRLDDLTRRFRELSQSHTQLKLEDKRLLEKYKAAVEEKDVFIQKLQGDAQGVANRLLASELEARRLREMERLSSEESMKKVRKLEGRIEELTASHQQAMREAEGRFKGQLKELKTTVSKYQQELEERLHRIEELNQGVLMLQSEVQEVTAELTAARGQLAQQGQLYTIEVNKLRNAMREMEQNYDANLRTLEEELSAMSKELTALKFSREAGNSRLKASRTSDTGDDRATRRLEERLKLKDRRIEELKQTVLVLEHSLQQQSPPQGKVEPASAVESLRVKMTQMQREHREAMEKKATEVGRLAEQLKQIKQEVLRLKTREEELSLALEEKEFQLQATASELAIVSSLYAGLQRDVERTKKTTA